MLAASEVQIAGGQSHALVLTPDGRVWAFGDDSRGQLGDDTTRADKAQGVLVSGLSDIIAIAAGRAHSLALRADGTVWSWGDNTSDQLGHNSGVTFKTTPVQIPGLSTVISIAAGGDHSLAVNVYGEVFAWGSDTDGELGNGATVGKQVTPANVLAVGGAGNLARAIAVAAGNTHSMALLADGTVVAWGRDVEGQLGNGAVVGNQIVPVVVTGLADVTAIACGWQHSLARLADGSVRAWGRNDVGQLGTFAGVNQPSAVNPGSTQVKAVSAGENHSVFQFVDGSLAACGNDLQGAVGNNSTLANVAVPTAVALGGAATRTFAAGGNHTVACLADGSFQAWGSNSDGQLGFGSLIADQGTPVAVLVTWPMVAITHVDAANSHSIALKSDGTVWAWGGNGSGQIGVNNTGPQYSPVQVLGLGGAGALSGIIAISSGSYGYQNLALAADGTVWAWGQGTNGQMGNNGNTNALTPVRVRNPGNSANLSGIVAIAAGDEHNLALSVDGSVYAWGLGTSGQLGNNASLTSLLPVKVKVSAFVELAKIKGLAAGNAHSLALNAAGDIIAWGANGSGQLGDGTGAGTKQLATTIDTGDWIGIAAGYGHSRALRVDSTPAGWGRNSEGQLGDSTTTQRNSVTIIGFSNARCLSAGVIHSLNWQAWGGSYGCGWNPYGQLGLGDTVSPVVSNQQITALGSNPYELQGGYYHSIVLKADGTVLCMGNNGSGQLGTGGTGGSVPNPTTTTPSWLPTVTISASDAVASEAGLDPGAFLLTRSGSNYSGALTVRVVLDGASTAATGDYAPAIPSTITIPAGSASTTFTVTPTQDFVNEPTEYVVLRVLQAATDPYAVTAAVTATITLLDNDPVGLAVTTPTLITLEKQLKLSTTGVSGGNLLQFPASTDLSNVRVGMRIYLSGATNASSYLTVTVVDDVNDRLTVTVNSGGLFNTAVAETVYIGYFTFFSVRLTSQPSNSVTIRMKADDDTEGKDPDPLTFTNSNWNIDQIVYVYSVDDPDDEGTGSAGDQFYNINFLPIAAVDALDPAYIGVTHASLSVTNVDDDRAAIVVSTSTLAVTEGGNTDSYTVQLNSRPASDVTVTITSGNGEVTVIPTTLTFTYYNWNSPRQVTVTAVNDNFVEGTHSSNVALASTTSGGGTLYDGAVTLVNETAVAGVVATITDNDVAEFELQPVTSVTDRLVITENGSAQIKVRLKAQPRPTKEVHVDLSISNWIDVGTGSPDPGTLPDFNGAGLATVSLTFDNGNWNTYQTITVFARDDVDSLPEIFRVNLDTPNATTTEDAFDATTDSVYARTQDDDTPRIIVTNRNVADSADDTSTDVVEGGASDRIRVVLSVVPNATETVVVNLDAGTQCTATPSFLIFTAGNWNAPRTVIIAAVDDFVDEALSSPSPINLTLSSTGASGGPAIFDLSMTASVIANVTDNDTAGIAISAPATLVTTEAGGQASFSIVLTSQPAGAVTIPLSIGGADLDEAAVTASVLFSTTNWSTAQFVTVTGLPDSLDDGDRPYTVITGAATVASPGDSNFVNRNPPDIQGLNVDDDSVGVTVSTTSIAITEGGSTVDYTIRLNSQPTGSVTVTVIAGNQLTVDTDTSTGAFDTNLVFEPTNVSGKIWSVARPVRVTAIDDSVAETSPDNVLVTLNASGSDYTGVVIANIGVAITDNDNAGFLFNTASLTAPAGLSVSEDGTNTTYTLRLRSQPTADVRLILTSSDTGEGTVDVDDVSAGNQDTLIFTPANWNVDRIITVTGVEDDEVDGAPSFSVVASAVLSPDFRYNGLQALPVIMTNADNDIAYINISPTTGLTTSESGGQASFSVQLNSQPAASVTVSFVSSNSLQGTIDTDSSTDGNQTTLIFSPANWNVGRTVTITGQDGDALDNGVAGVAYQITGVSVSSTDATYSVLIPGNVQVTNLAVNNVPTLGAIADRQIVEDSGAQSVPLAGISVGQAGEIQTLTFVVTSSDTTLIPTASAALTGATTGTLSFTPGTNQTGTATITVTVTDDGGPGTLAAESVVRTFEVTVTEVNDPPNFTALASPITLNEGAATQTLGLVGLSSGAVNESQSLTVTVVSSNVSVVPNPLSTSSGSNVVVLAPGVPATDFTYAPAAQANGIAVITVTVQDDGGTADGGLDTLVRQFTVNVTAVNDPPTLDDPVDVVIAEDAGIQSINLTGIGSGAVNEAQVLVVSAVSSDPSLIPNPTVTYITPAAAGTLVFTPAAERGGQAIITVTVDDGGGGTQTLVQTFSVTVNPVNDAPVVTSTVAAGRLVPIDTNRRIEATDLYATDVDSANPAPAHDPGLVFTVQLAPGQGFLLRDLDTLDAPVIEPGDAEVLGLGRTFTQQDLIEGRISYSHDGGSGASDGFAFTVSDSGIVAGSVSSSPPLPAANLPVAVSGLQVFTITIDRRAPVIYLQVTDDLEFTEDDDAIAMVPSANVDDDDIIPVDGFEGGFLLVTITSGGTVSDRIGLDLTGPITLTGSNVFFNNGTSEVLIGSLSNTVTAMGSVLRVDFTSAAADEISVRALIRRLTFQNVSQVPSDAESEEYTTRMVRFLLTDSNDDVSAPVWRTIVVRSVNDAPTSSTLTALVTGVNVPLSGTLAVTDVDGDTVTYAQEGVTTLCRLFTLNTVTGAYTFTPEEDESGDGTFVIRATDENGAYIDLEFTVTVSADTALRPWITSDPPMDAVEGDSAVTYNIVTWVPSGALTVDFTIIGLDPSQYALSEPGNTTATLTILNTALATPGPLTFGILVVDGLLTGFQPVTIQVLSAPAGAN